MNAIMKEEIKDWVALLDEDEDDYLFWQHGFGSWATHLELHWFGSIEAFLRAAALARSNPAALVMDGVAPRGEETKWLGRMLLHPRCAQSCIIMLSEQMQDEQHQAFMSLGATDHLLKPVSIAELQATVLTVSRHIAARS